LLSLCAVNGYLNGIKHLIKDGADTTSLTVSSRGETMNLTMAICNNPHFGPPQIKCLSYLLDKGICDPNEINTCGQTALMFAYRTNSEEMISILFKNGADPSIVDMRGLIAEDYKQN
jgi:ankyrin repeat protein